MSVVESFCGEYPDGFVKTDIASDPNYVFVNDSDYGSVQLFNSEGSTIFVNSFIECEHYVTGGWELRILSRSSTSTIFWRTILKLLWYFLNFRGFLVVMSASQSVIKSSIYSPASKTKRRTAASVMCSLAKAIGRELMNTNF